MLTHYAYFIAIVDHGGLSAAATALGLSQPALSRSLQALERRLGQPLLHRSGHRLTLTEAGSLTLPRARAILADDARLRADLAAPELGPGPSTHVHGSPLTMLALLPRILTRVLTEQPSPRITVRGDSSSAFDWKLQALLAGRLDALLTMHVPLLANPTLAQTPLLQPELRVVVARTHRAAERGVTSLSALRDERFIVPPRGSPPRSLIDAAFRAHGFSPRDALEIADWHLTLELVRSTGSVVAMPYHPACFADPHRALCVLPIQLDARVLPVSLIVRELASGQAGTHSFVAAARAVVSAFEAGPLAFA